MKKRRWWLRILIALVVLAALAGAGLLAYVPYMQMPAFVDKHVEFKETYQASAYGLEAQPLTLTTEDGLKLAAWQVDAPSPRAAVVFVSGIHNPSVTAFFGHAAMLRERGFSSVLVEMRAHGQSEGDVICMGMKEYMDVRAAVRHIKGQSPELPVVAFGLSMGAATAINAIGETPEIAGLISLSAFSSWPDVFAENMEMTGLPKAVCEAEKPFVWLYMGMKYGFDSLPVNPLAEISKLNGRPALLMHSTGDTQVPFRSFERLTQAAPGVETFVREGDFHLICDDNFLHPLQDKAYSDAVLGFLDKHF